MCVHAYTLTNEGNALKLDSENAGEIVEGERIERSPFKSHSTSETQSGKIPVVEQLNVEFAKHREAF